MIDLETGRSAGIRHPRARRLLEQLQRHGVSEVARLGALRISQRLGTRLNWRDFDLPLRPGDIADSTTLSLPPRPAPAAGRPLHIGWVCTAPAAGSGGHTTLFRMVQGLEERGHRCTLFLYDRDSDDVSRHIETIRRHWPGMKAGIRSATPQIDGVDAVVASSWATAHVVAARSAGPVHRFYFIQDFEPFFYPRGDLYAFAEDTYRFGFTNIALGAMVAGRIAGETGVEPFVTVPFGCDTDVYRLLPQTPPQPRSGVVFYAKRNTDRRGYLLGRLALEAFHREHPDQEIHVVGDRTSGWPVPVTNHGNLSPAELNSLYNRTIAGIAISFTNVSLVAEEMLAAGNIPVLNDSSMARADLPNRHAVWAPATPSGLAGALSGLVEGGGVQARAELAAASVRHGWGGTQRLVGAAIEEVCAG